VAWEKLLFGALESGQNRRDIAAMSVTSQLLASGPGWRVLDHVCTAGPDVRPFQEQHRDSCIAVVTRGSFQYRTREGGAVMAPGSLLLGNPAACFECGHEHAAGDRCLAFHYAPEHFETIASAVPGARRGTFSTPHLPPMPELMPLIAAAEAARDECDPAALEELSVRFAGAVLTLCGGARPTPLSYPSRRDERRVTRALRRIESDAEAPLTLAALAREAATSPYHFLRIFRQLVGMTPHQYILRTRLTHVALRLRRSREPVAAIAFNAGFNDLSTFNRRFRRLLGVSPTAYRAGAGRSLR
jgi:AraC-like DNA-binding protein